MRVIDVQQGSQDWLKARAGIPTASSFDLIITSKGEPSKQRQKYLYKLAGEKIAGIPEESYKSVQMARGNELEEEARKFYQFVTGNLVSTVGLCLSDCGSYGASPDGMIGDKGSLEIKCPSMAVHVEYLLNGKVPTDHYQQTQGQLLVTGCEFLEFISYYPGIKPLIIRVEPDAKFQQALKSELLAFVQELEEITNKIRG